VSPVTSRYAIDNKESKTDEDTKKIKALYKQVCVCVCARARVRVCVIASQLPSKLAS
jgi:hypothetical protein